MEPKGTLTSGARETRKKAFARRALMQAGWVVPALAVFGLPGDVGAASAHGDTGHADAGAHTDNPGVHSDNGGGFHSDGHGDAGAPHDDVVPGGHFDVIPGVHSDANAFHGDNGVFSPHGDGPG